MAVNGGQRSKCGQCDGKFRSATGYPPPLGISFQTDWTTAIGNIVVFTGIIPVAKDEDGLAAILGHGLSSGLMWLSLTLIRGTEIAHVVARHNAERYSSMKVLLGFATLLEVLGLDIGIARLLTTFLLDLPNSRKQELEGSQVFEVVAWKFLTTCSADVIGLRLSAKACYSPEAAAE